MTRDSLAIIEFGSMREIIKAPGGLIYQMPVNDHARIFIKGKPSGKINLVQVAVFEHRGSVDKELGLPVYEFRNLIPCGITKSIYANWREFI